VLCDMSLQMDKQKLKYDDMFYMSFNGQVIASNANYVIKGQTTQVAGRITEHPGLTASSIVVAEQVMVPTYSYDWTKIRGGYFDNDWLETFDSNYCLGQEQGLASCSWPETEETGDFEFSYDPTVLKALGSLSSSGIHTFKFAITGDNDVNVDCFHEEFTFDVEVKYFIPSQNNVANN
ncbi:MAG: hypothetical protein AAF202_06045, partial [Pseudomonadota bacterium]